MDVTFSQIAAGLGLTAIAGLATGVGSCIAFFAKKQKMLFVDWEKAEKYCRVSRVNT